MSQFRQSCALFVFLMWTLVDYGRTNFCYHQEARTTRSLTFCDWLLICQSHKTYYVTVKDCCVGWTGEKCNIPIYSFTTPEPDCGKFDENNLLTTNSTEVEPSEYVPVIGDVLVNKSERTMKGANKEYPISRVYFVCGFHHSMTKDLLYRVTWFQNGCKMLVTGLGKSQNDTLLHLTESQFKSNGFSLGNQISCDVQAYAHKDGIPSKSSGRSKGLFVGIELLTRVLVINAGETATVRFTTTIPIGCTAVYDCSITIKAVIPDEDIYGPCSGLAIQGRRCGTKLLSNKPIGTVYEMNVTTVENGQYQTKDGYYEIFLEVDAGLENEIWKDYKLPKIHVHIQRPVNGGGTAYGKLCYSYNDPHMKTFDSLRYELQDVNANYTLYKNSLYDSEIQIRLKRCNNHRALCNCGIAVRAGQDIYKIDLCKSDSLFMNYITCGDKSLKVKSDKGWKYKIFLPYGTYAEADVQRIYGALFLGIRIVPSSHDYGGKSSGLCGSFDNNDNNDFRLRDGTVVNKRETFTQSWRVVDETENMFSEKFDETKLQPLQNEVHVCVCRNATRAENGDSRLYDLSCNPNAVATCMKGRDTSVDSCASKTRVRRSVDRNPIVPKVKVNNDFLTGQRKKRQTQQQIWDQAEAEAFCKKHIKQSPVFDKCSAVPNVKTEEAIENCALDLVLTQEPTWANISAEAMQSECVSELQRNTSLWNSDEPNTPSVADQIEALACMNNCSMRGLCSNGVCKCENGYGLSDCSLSTNQGPAIVGLLDNGLCDERDLICSHAYIFGHYFDDSENLTCKLVPFKLSMAGERNWLQEMFVKAQFDTFIEVICPLENHRRKRSVPDIRDTFVYGYTVQVSNDGAVYGSGRDIYLYNSECQLPEGNENEAHFVLMDGFCYINGQCVGDGDFNINDNCSICDPGRNKLGWSISLIETECIPVHNKSSESQNLWIIAVVLPAVAVTTAIILFLIYHCNTRKTKVTNSQIVDFLVVLRHYDAAKTKFAPGPGQSEISVIET